MTNQGRTHIAVLAAVIAGITATTGIVMALPQGNPGDPAPTAKAEGWAEARDWFEDGKAGTNEEAEETLEEFENAEFFREGNWDEDEYEFDCESAFQAAIGEMREHGKLGSPQKREGAKEYFNADPKPPIF